MAEKKLTQVGSDVSGCKTVFVILAPAQATILEELRGCALPAKSERHGHGKDSNPRNSFEPT